ncbi:DUF3304 domain-containing protein [Massilia sp. TN1-12]|uniref:DUF3304 domain-containing protein n=1 Tax=Massilia paldalensis TaxID=3377675 RepID=UPI00384BA23C
MNTEMRKWIVLAAMCAAVVPAVGHAEQKIPVSIHGINYSNEDFSFTLVDPEDPRNEGGGELVGRFSGGGTVCCYALPRNWHPGIKILIKSQHWLKRDADGKLPEIDETHTVEVPRYADDKVSDLWVLRQQDGSYAVISSRYQPDHQKWPGEVKGWPVPSLEYRQERIKLELSSAEDSVETAEQVKREIETNPGDHAKRMWPLMADGPLIDRSKYRGPDDENFRDFLNYQNEDNLRFYRERVRLLRNMAK